MTNKIDDKALELENKSEEKAEDDDKDISLTAKLLALNIMELGETKAHKDTIKYYSKVLRDLSMGRPALDYQVYNITHQIELAHMCIADGYEEPDKINEAIKFKTERIENIKRIMGQADKLIDELITYALIANTRRTK